MQEGGVNQHLALVAVVLLLDDEPSRLKHRKYLLAELIVVEHPAIDGVVLGEDFLPREPYLSEYLFLQLTRIFVLFFPCLCIASSRGTLHSDGREYLSCHTTLL